MFELLDLKAQPVRSSMSLVSVRVVRYPLGAVISMDELDSFELILPMDWEDHLEDITDPELPGRTVYRAKAMLIGMNFFGGGYSVISPEDRCQHIGCSWDWEVDNCGVPDSLEDSLDTLVALVNKYVPPDYAMGSFFMLFNASYSQDYDGEVDVHISLYDPQDEPLMLKSFFGVV